MVDQDRQAGHELHAHQGRQHPAGAGGFLVFNLDDALTEPLVWKPLKRVLKSGRLEIESYNPSGSSRSRG